MGKKKKKALKKEDSINHSREENLIPPVETEKAEIQKPEARPNWAPKREVKSFSEVLERTETILSETDEPKPDNWFKRLNRNKYLTKQISRKWAIGILVLTLLISIVLGYVISDQYVWVTNQEKKIQERINYYEKQMKKEPNEPRNRVELGFALFLRKDYQGSIKQYQTALQIDNNYYPAFLNLAIVYDEMNQPKKSLENATKAVALAPLDYKGHLYMGRSYRKLKKYNQALKALQDADRVSKGNMDILMETAKVAEAQGEYQVAKQIYQNALAHDPTSEPAYQGVTRMEKKLNEQK